VDAHLKLLAEVSLAVERAEAAACEGAFTGAREALDEAETGLQVLRERWPEMGAAERALVGRAAAPVKQRLDAVSRALPRPSALSQAAPEHDPEQEQDPAAARTRGVRAGVLTAVSSARGSCSSAAYDATSHRRR
jgi:hypothetical protein